MKSKEYKILLDIYKGVQNPQKVEFVTEDNGTAKLKFKLFEDKITPYSLENCVVRMVIQDQQQNCIITDESNGECEITLLGGMFKDANNYIAELQVYDSSNQTLRLTTPQFRYNVRASLMNGENVQADPNFSILQDMILEVSNANEVANNAKVTAENALATANQATTTIEGEIAKVDKAVLDANTALDRAANVVTQTELEAKATELDASATTKVNNKIGINSVFDPTIFNFTGSKVEQNGLLQSSLSFEDNKPFSFNIKFKIISLPTSTVEVISHKTSAVNGFSISVTGSGNLLFRVNNVKYTILKLGVRVGETFGLTVLNNVDRCIVYINGTPVTIDSYSLINTTNTSLQIQSASLFDTKINYLYNRVLTPQEIQHNFTVLNNAESINALESGGKKLLFSVNTDHVTDRTGRTQEQINRRAYKRTCREFTSTGEPITVNNAEEGYVLSAEIKGQTVKNLFSGESDIGYFADVAEELKPSSATRTTKWIACKPSTKYTIYTNTSGDISMNRCGCQFKSKGIITYLSGGNELKEWTVTTPVDCEYVRFYYYNSVDATNIVTSTNAISIIEGDKRLDKVLAPLSLNSTQAILNNNGSLYPIYEPTIVGKTRILNDEGLEVDTGLVPTDPLLPPLKDGDVLDLATRTITFANKTTRVLTEDELKAYLTYRKVIFLGSTTTKKDTLELKEDGSAVYTQNTKDATDGSARVDLTTPVVFSIDKSLMPTIATSDKINICQVESAVAPSEFKVSVPVDRIGELEARLQAVEVKTNTQPVNLAFVDETYAKSINKINEVNVQ